VTAAAFAFPLNVYATMLEAAEGRLDYLHYGLFEHDDEPVWRAQERASQLLWSALPPPCRVLEVGIGVGTTLRRLGAAGYQAFGITPDAAQVAEVRRRHGDAVQVAVSTLEELPARQEPWDLMLLQESAQYIQPLALFEAADRLLVAEDATIVVMDEFAFERRSAADSGLHTHAHFLALARRMGWEATVDMDVSQQASGTVRAIHRLIQGQQADLQRALSLRPGQLEDLLQASQRYQALYAQGTFGYRLLRLRRRSRPTWRLGIVGSAQSGAMSALFRQVFDKTMDEAEWHWKYGQGRGCAVGQWQGEQLVAHYGAASRPVRMDGQTHLACQVGDVMVLPQANAGLGRQGAFQMVSATLLEGEIGFGQRHLLGFGFPNARAMKVAERLKLYAPVDEVVQLEWLGATRRRWRDAVWRVAEVQADALQEGTATWDALDRAWHAMAAALPRALLPVRDAAWICYRYGQRPGSAYRVRLLFHRLRGLRGAQCLGGWVTRQHADHDELMDLVGSPEHFPMLIRAARLAAAARGLLPLRAWITASHAGALIDPADPPSRAELDVQVPTCIHTAGPAPETLRGRWFLMAGDTDFR
jgi:SAM-dependent methyltransferase